MLPREIICGIKKTKADYVGRDSRKPDKPDIAAARRWSIGRSSASGGNVRALVKGVGIYQFNELDNLSSV